MAKQETKPGAPALLAAVQSATATDLETIRGRIAELRNELDALVAIERVVDIRLNGKTQRASPGTKKAAGSELATKLYDEIAKRGPGTPSELAQRIGAGAAVVGVLASKNSWFMRDSQNRVAIAKAG